MSDGPYKSLPLPHGWKKAARWAERETSSCAHVGSVIESAIAQDWERDGVAQLAKRVCQIFNDTQGSLLTTKVSELEGLLPIASDSAFKQLLLDCALRRAAAGEIGDEAAVNATQDAINVDVARKARAMEEHYARKWGNKRAGDFRVRIEQSAATVAFPKVARTLLGLEKAAPIRMPGKQTGLDEGARL